MEIIEKKIAVQKTARYIQLGEITPETTNLIYVLHGYGQLVEYFIKHFEPLHTAQNCIVAPEGLSRFYLDGAYKRVGASWMTRVDRLSEIEDHVKFLDEVHTACTQDQDMNEMKITLLGFSQGVATAYRWLKKGAISPENVIFWAGSPPSTEKDHSFIQKIRKSQVHFAVGDQDEFISPENAQKIIDALRNLHPNIKTSSFPGKHTIHAATLREIGRSLKIIK